jgi:hypothetical protein
MGTARDRAPHRTRARGLARPQSRRPVPTLASPSSHPCRLGAPKEHLGHTDVTTTMISTPVLNRREKCAQPGRRRVRSRSRCGLCGSAYHAGRKRHRFDICPPIDELRLNGGIAEPAG